MITGPAIMQPMKDVESLFHAFTMKPMIPAMTKTAMSAFTIPSLSLTWLSGSDAAPRNLIQTGQLLYREKRQLR